MQEINVKLHFALVKINQNICYPSKIDFNSPRALIQLPKQKMPRFQKAMHFTSKALLLTFSTPGKQAKNNKTKKQLPVGYRNSPSLLTVKERIRKKKKKKLHSSEYPELHCKSKPACWHIQTRKALKHRLTPGNMKSQSWRLMSKVWTRTSIPLFLRCLGRRTFINKTFFPATVLRKGGTRFPLIVLLCFYSGIQNLPLL